MSRGNIPFAVRTPEELDALATAFGADAYKPQVKEHLGKPEAPPRDNVNLPQHYARHKIEPIRYNIENRFDGFQFNINKYTARAYDKHETPVEDIKKVLRYSEMWLKHVSGDPDWHKASTMTIPGYFP